MSSLFWRILLGHGLALVLGWGAYTAGVPLAWVLGPMVGSAIVALSGYKPYAPTPLRRLGQIIIGTAIGLNVTAAVLGRLAEWLPWMVITAVVLILLSAALSVVFARFARTDHKTAYFAMLPGGLTEMANLAQSTGARGEPVAVAQTIRVALVVSILPPLIVSFGIEGAVVPTALTWDEGYLSVLILLGIGTLGALALRLTRFPNPWLLGALAAVALATSTELILAGMPRPVFYAGQFLVGFAIGTRFQRDVLMRLPRLSVMSGLFVIVLSAVMGLYALLLTQVGEINIATAILSAAIGGASEMAVTAQTLHLDVALVAAFHVFRAALVNACAVLCWNLLSRSGFFRAVARVTGRPV